MRWGASHPASEVREPAVAGQFYTGRADRLAAEVDRYLADARRAMEVRVTAARAASGAEREGAAPVGGRGAGADPPERGAASPSDAGDSRHGKLVAVVAPHAGHIYSGPTAGYAYAAIEPAAVRRVVLFGPAHYVPIDGIGLSSATSWRTPLGDIPIDGEVGADLRAHFDDVIPGDAAHAPEHSLEVQLPFLQRVLDPGWALVPLIVGADLPEELATVIARCAALPETLVVVSTDLSHYLDHDAAVARDARTIAAVLDRRAEGVGPYDACGRYPLRGLLLAAAAADWSLELLDARNSGDTAGDWDRVVGYAAFAVRESVPGEVPQSDAAAAATGRVTDTDQDTSQFHDTGDPAPDVPSPTSAAVMDSDQDTSQIHDTSGPERNEAGRIGAVDRAALLRLARRTISDALETGRRPHVDPAEWPDSLRHPGAAFVTLRSGRGDLLGCIGSLSAYQPLVSDVAEHAYDAAFRDPRFPPMTPERAQGMVIDISVLSPTEPFPCSGYQNLLARVPVGSGLVVTAGRHRATFLPAVWEQLPEPGQFLAALWRKAGLRPGDWPPGTTIEVYDSEEFAER